MRQSTYAVHITLEPLPSTIGQYWEQPAIALTYAAKLASRKADLSAANKVKGKAGSFLRSAAFKALNNLNNIRSI